MPKPPGGSVNPYLLIDVDGVLNPFAAKPTERPDGYETYRPTPVGWSRPLRLWLNPAHGPMLLAITGVVEMVWATTWGEHDQANTVIGPLIGLPRLPTIQLERAAPRVWGQIWKRGAVEAFVGDRPFAWFDDQFERDDMDWAGKRTAAGSPTLLVPINPAVGIVRADVDRVAEWAREVA